MKLFPSEFDFNPTSFSLPEEEKKLKSYMKKNPKDVIISKPASGSGGDGIFLFNKLEKIPRSLLKPHLA